MVSKLLCRNNLLVRSKHYSQNDFLLRASEAPAAPHLYILFDWSGSFTQEKCCRNRSDTATVDILWLKATLAFTNVRLSPSMNVSGHRLNEGKNQTDFLILIDSIWMNPVVSVGSNPPNSSMEDCCSS
jgi:hypothetical protein